MQQVLRKHLLIEAGKRHDPLRVWTAQLWLVGPAFPEKGKAS